MGSGKKAGLCNGSTLTGFDKVALRSRGTSAMRTGQDQTAKRPDISWAQWDRCVLVLTGLDSTLGSVTYLLCDFGQED